jgi:hypothetical protein
MPGYFSPAKEDLPWLRQPKVFSDPAPGMGGAGPSPMAQRSPEELGALRTQLASRDVTAGLPSPSTNPWTYGLGALANGINKRMEVDQADGWQRQAQARVDGERAKLTSANSAALDGMGANPPRPTGYYGGGAGRDEGGPAPVRRTQMTTDAPQFAQQAQPAPQPNRALQRASQVQEGQNAGIDEQAVAAMFTPQQTEFLRRLNDVDPEKASAYIEKAMATVGSQDKYRFSTTSNGAIYDRFTGKVTSAGGAGAYDQTTDGSTTEDMLYGGLSGDALEAQKALVARFGKPDRGYRWKADGSGDLEPIPGGSAAMAGQNKSRYVGLKDGSVLDKFTGKIVHEGEPPPRKFSSTDAKELYEADDSIKASQAAIASLEHAISINDEALDGWWAEGRGDFAANVFGSDVGKKTKDLKSTVSSMVLNSLKSTFGGNPTEGERQILAEVSGSVSDTKENRKLIYERALAAAKIRVTNNIRKVYAIKTGELYDPSIDPYGAQTGGEATAAPPPVNYTHKYGLE